ncbi:MAG: methyltransferase domain-containing protein, partial [Deltaproteobacteria bacterium]|nr:methyltransferase domain-containing protein [Deltaproteobacteria bacterium]
IPYKVDRITNSVFPVKLCEYMAGGKPVVTTNMKECRKFKSVLVSESREDFIQHIRKALLLKDNSDYLKVLSEEAYSNRWEERVDQIISPLESERLLEPLKKERIEERLSIATEEIEAMQKLLNQSIYQIEALNSKFIQTIGERDNLWNQLNQTIAERDNLSNQLHQTITERDNLSNQLHQTIAERNNLSNQLNNIYSSDFWKVASFYYRARDKSILLRSIHGGLKWLKRDIKNNLYIKDIPKFIVYAKRYGLKQALRRSYKKLKAVQKPPPHTYVKIELHEMLRRGKDKQGIVIYPPTIDWNHTLFQRPHHIMLGLARKGFTVIFCTPNQIDSLRSDFVSLEENLFLCKNSDALLNLSGRRDLILYISNTMHKPLVEKLKPAKVIYDYIDELEVFGNYDPGMVVAHEELLRNANLVLVTAERLWREVQHIRRNAILCPNAVDYWHFASAQLIGPRPLDFERRGLTSRPIIGYYGALAEWIDYDLLAKAAMQRPNYDFVLIGLDYDGSLHKSTVTAIPNVHYLGPKEYIELPQYLRYFDVGIIPFKLNKITHSTSPLKLFEYMSALKPVVTTAMDELKKYSCILIAHDSDEFVNLLDKAITLKTSMTYLESLRQEALENTWDRRVEMITRWIRQPHFQRALTEYMNSKVSPNHPMYHTYLEFASSTVERGDAMVEIVSNHAKIRGKRCLDVGCAYGGFPIAFAQAGTKEVVGVDINCDYIDLAHELLKDHKCVVQPKFFVHDILKDNVEKDLGKFDIITCNDVIEHVSSPELLVKNLSSLIKPEGVLYLEIPNAYHYGMVARDGHYGLFGITLLDPANALLYYGHHFKSLKSLPYAVGEYLDLNGYIELFGSHEFEPVLLNDIPQNEKELNQIAKNIQSLSNAYQTAASKALPESLKEHMGKVLKNYVDGFSLSYERFLKSSGETKAAVAKHIYVYYGIDFWRFLLRKKKYSGNP